MLTQALAQLPDAFYDMAGNLIGEKILMRTDRAGKSGEFLYQLDSPRSSKNSASDGLMIRSTGPVWDADGRQHNDAVVIDGMKVIELKDYPAGTSLYLMVNPWIPGRKIPCPIRTGTGRRRS